MSCASSRNTGPTGAAHASSPDLMIARDGLDPALRGSLWRHRKTQGIYRILGKCRIEATGADAFLYQGDQGTIWARPVDEFLDGRFERLAAETGQ